MSAHNRVQLLMYNLDFIILLQLTYFVYLNLSMYFIYHVQPTSLNTSINFKIWY